MKFRTGSITHGLHILMVVISLIVAITPPVIHFIVGYLFIAKSTNVEITFTARAVENIIASNPSSWRFEEIRLHEILEHRIDNSYRENRIIKDLQGNVITQMSGNLTWPVVTYSQPVYDSGIEVARIEFKRSITRLVTRIALIGTSSILLGMLIFFLFYFFPLRTVRNAYGNLQENEQRLALALYAGCFGVLDWDINNNVMTWDDRMYEIYGVSRNTFKVSREAWKYHVHREDRERFMENLRPEVIALKGYHTEFRIVQSGGTLKYIKADGIVVRDEHGNPSRLIGLNSDITKRKLTEEALRFSEERFKSIVATSQEWIWIMDHDGIYTLSNPAIKDILGYEPEEIIGRHFMESCVHEDHLPKLKQILDQSVRQKQGWQSVVLRWKHKDGTTRYLESWGVPIFDKSSNLQGFQGSDRDVTARKQAADMIRKNEERYRTIFECTATPNIIIDEDMTIIMANNDFADWSGCLKQGLEGKIRLADFIHEDDREEIMNWAMMLRLNPGSVPPSFECRSINRKGEFRDLILNAGAIPETKEMIVSLIDLTERRQLEAQLFQARKMESVGRLAGGVAHVFNNMLGVIIGNVEMALDGIASSDPLHYTMRHILNAAKRAADLTRQLLAFARKQNVSPKVLNLNDSVTGMLKVLQELIGEDIKLVWGPGQELWRVKIDPSQFDQLMANLLMNASDATNRAEKIIIETSNTICERAFCASHPGCRPGEYVLLAVSDDGCGMEKEILANIFEPFFTAHKEGRGTDLGLATAYGIVKQNHGFIYVYSEPDMGTVFRIYLPRYREDAIAVADDRVMTEAHEKTDMALIVE